MANEKNFPRKSVDAVLDKLATDDKFRERFQRNPRAALLSIGAIEAGDDNVTDQPIESLASKEEISSTRDALRTSMMAKEEPYIPITLDIAKR